MKLLLDTDLYRETPARKLFRAAPRSRKRTCAPELPQAEACRIVLESLASVSIDSTGGKGLQPEDQNFQTIHQELHRLAKKQMGNERANHTLQATSLVNEAYLKLKNKLDLASTDRTTFFRTAAVAMRRILIDHARKRRRKKRGGDQWHVPLDITVAVETMSFEETVALNEAMERLENKDVRAAEVVHFLFYLGLSVNETAEMLGISPRTVDRDWAYARAWLLIELGGRVDDEPPKDYR